MPTQIIRGSAKPWTDHPTGYRDQRLTNGGILADDCSTTATLMCAASIKGSCFSTAHTNDIYYEFKIECSAIALILDVQI